MTGPAACKAQALLVELLRTMSCHVGDDDALRAARVDGATVLEMGRLFDAVRQAVDEELGYPCTHCGDVLVDCAPSDEAVCAVCDSRQIDIDWEHCRSLMPGVSHG